jgi:hypothetical protein
VGIRCADHVTPLYPQTLALTSPTGGGRSVGIVRSRTKAMEFSLVFIRKITKTSVRVVSVPPNIQTLLCSEYKSEKATVKNQRSRCDAAYIGKSYKVSGEICPLHLQADVYSSK